MGIMGAMIITIAILFGLYFAAQKFDSKGKIDKFFNKICPSYREYHKLDK